MYMCIAACVAQYPSLFWYLECAKFYKLSFVCIKSSSMHSSFSVILLFKPIVQIDWILLVLKDDNFLFLPFRCTVQHFVISVLVEQTRQPVQFGTLCLVLSEQLFVLFQKFVVLLDHMVQLTVELTDCCVLETQIVF